MPNWRSTCATRARGCSSAGIPTARYGDFVLYRPPLKGTTLVLWFGPGLLLIGGLFTLFLVLRRRSRLSPDQFEADPDEEPPAAPSETTRSTLTASRHD